MRTRVFPIVAAAVALGFLLHVSSVAQAPANRGPRTVDGKPDLNGIWQALNKANWDIETHGPSPGPSTLGAIGSMPPGMGVVEGDTLPYLPAAACRIAGKSLTLPGPGGTWPCLIPLSHGIPGEWKRQTSM